MCYFLAISAGVAATVLIALAAPWLAREQLAAPQLSSTLRLGGGLVFLGAITGVQGGILTGFEAFQRQARINVTAALFSAPLLIIGVGYAGLNGGILALTGGLLLTAFLNHTAIRHLAREHGMRLWRSDAFQEFPVLGRFTLFAFLGTMMGVPINWFCNSVLVTQPGGYEQMGIFNAANQWRMIILFLPATVGSVLLPIMTRVYGQGDYLHHTKMLRLSIFLNSGVALLLALPLMVFARPVLCMYGAGFSSGETAFFLLMLGAIVIAVNNGMSRAIVSLGRIKTDLLFHIIWGAVFLLTGWLLIPRFGLNGLALATILGALLQGACQWIWLMAHYRNRSRVAHSG